MAKWNVYGKVVAGTFVGVYEAETVEEAEKIAWADAVVSVCHQCANQIDDPEVVELIVERADD